jgi:hypothetical protein
MYVDAEDVELDTSEQVWTQYVSETLYNIC